ncbi:MAG: glycosyltransferase family 4 protein [Asgard group archaeon]|nr:glycosyltransferase family 4 protein [Asgard group archaeon]
MEVKKIIAFYIDRFSKNDVGGVKSYIRRITKHLNNSSIEAIILTQKTKQNPQLEDEIDNVKIIRFDCGDFVDRTFQYNNLNYYEREEKAGEYFQKDDIESAALKLAEYLSTFIEEYKPSSIHFHNSFFIAPYALYFLKQSYKLQATPSYYFWCHSPTMQLILPNKTKSNLYNALASFQNNFKGVFAISKNVHQQLLNAGIQNKIRYLGVDTRYFDKRDKPELNIREKLGISENAFLITYTGRFLKGKGLAKLPEIYKKLINRDKKFLTINVLLVGDGPYKQELKNFITKENLDHKFHFTKVTNDSDLIDIYSQSNCFILPTKREAIGLSLMEAMSCSLPCIATDLPGTRELITHLKNGILIPEEKEEEYLRWISSFYSSSKLRNSIAVAARKTIEENFSFNTHINYFIKRLIR